MTDTLTAPIAEPVGIPQAFPEGLRAMLALEKAMGGSALDKTTYELVKLRASQINGCGYCLDMHSKDARALGESEARIYLLNAWREAPHYTRRERAALALTESITLIADGHTPEDVEAEAREVFTAEEYAALVFAIVTINAWNRLTITNHTVVGEYQPGQHATS
jgi:AhpD family alkylhydroperoxidase